MTRRLPAWRPLVLFSGRVLLLFWMVANLAFLGLNMAGNNPVDLYLDARVPPDQRERIKAYYGYDQSAAERYQRFMTALVHGELGYSFTRKKAVADVLPKPMLRSLALGFCACAMAVVGACLLLWARQPHAGAPRLLQRLATLVHQILLVTPSFLIAILLLQWVAVRWRWFPLYGSSVAGGVVSPSHLVLPSLAVALPFSAYLVTYLQEHLADHRHQSWYQSARGRGISEARLFWNHQLRMALPLLLQIIGLYLPALCSGVLIVENIFGWSGMGLVMIDAVTGRDIPLLVGAALWSAWLTTLGYQFADRQRRRLITTGVTA